MTREVDHYELRVDVHGPHYHDSTTLRAEDADDLKPMTRVIGDLRFEFYSNVDDRGYVEFRADYVIARELTVVYRDADAVDTRRESRLPAMVGALDRESTKQPEER